jgi:DNA-binding LacI/PurR family transcriptional regulator
VARRAGVAVDGLARVPGQGPWSGVGVTEETVRRCARELGYRPNVAAQALRLGTSRAVALLVPA